MGKNIIHQPAFSYFYLTENLAFRRLSRVKPPQKSEHMLTSKQIHVKIDLEAPPMYLIYIWNNNSAY